MLDHERLEVYQLAREFSREICRLSQLIKRGRSDLKLQLLRATASVPLNIAEGAGEYSVGRKAHFYRIARSSATECGSNLDHIIDMGLLPPHEVVKAKALLDRIVPMLVALVLSVERRAEEPIADDRPLKT